MDKFITVDEAVAKIKSGMTLMIGGFLAAGTPNKIVEALSKTDVKDLTIIANDTAYPDKGIGLLITNKQVKKVIASHIGTNPNTIQQLNDKELIVEFSPQGTLAERIRCGGAGLGGVLTPTGIGTVVEEGKQKLTIDGKEYLLEKPLHADIALIGANIADETGNLIYKGTTQNFNPMMATAADLVIAEAQEVVKTGEIPMENVHTPGIYVNYIVRG
ncbi:MAG: CoA transferase subunit A [Bacteroidales bacterium]|jgi:acetate CoA/acetoacetate CoA-transferase alpha subunit|nr:branched-chain amino acid dehydrogenase [Bacteroidota bacterium]MBO4655078.1 CoA transferase subunit A [Bacteroidales bacterium]MBR6064746.1 CoA transferase subunit A [Bacteroidales bacterium]